MLQWEKPSTGQTGTKSHVCPEMRVLFAGALLNRDAVWGWWRRGDVGLQHPHQVLPCVQGVPLATALPRRWLDKWTRTWIRSICYEHSCLCLGNTTLAAFSSLSGVDSAEECCYTQLPKAVRCPMPRTSNGALSTSTEPVLCTKGKKQRAAQTSHNHHNTPPRFVFSYLSFSKYDAPNRNKKTFKNAHF